MVPSIHQDKTLDSVEILNDLLEQVWMNLCCAYDAMGNLPEIKTLFEGADLSRPLQAAESVIANMLLEVIENVARFSPWYTRPARSFGLTSIREPVSKRIRWILAPEAVFKWQDILQNLSQSIEENYSLIQAMLFVEGLMDQVTPGETWFEARCSCKPPRSIQVTQAVLEKAEIICDACLKPFA